MKIAVTEIQAEILVHIMKIPGIVNVVPAQEEESAADYHQCKIKLYPLPMSANANPNPMNKGTIINPNT